MAAPFILYETPAAVKPGTAKKSGMNMDRFCVIMEEKEAVNMKKWMVLLCALLLCAPALAERELSCQVVGHQQLGGNDSGYDAYIVRVDVTDPQREIPPVYLLTEWVTEAGAQCELADVNFDGHEDLVAVVTLGTRC